jgi:antirestriction protein ArdC
VSLPRRANGQPYRGVNVLLLWGEATMKGYVSPLWVTYKQATMLGGQVKKGEHGALVVYADRYTKTETNGKGEEEERQIPFMKGYTVFNAEQVDGLPPHFYARANVPPRFEPIAHAEAFLSSGDATIHHGGNRAFYSPAKDFIQMPPRESFRDAVSYYATLAHELTHWTSHPERLARELGKRFGDNAYAIEELIAEMGSAFLCADLGLIPETRDDHAAYLASWLKVLKADSHAIFTAAAQAQRAADFMHACNEGRRKAAEAMPT